MPVSIPHPRRVRPGTLQLMDESTALSIGREWLSKVRASEDRLPVIRDTLQRITVQPETHALATDNRLALLAEKELWIVTIALTFEEDVTEVKIERFDLDADRVRLSLTETHWFHFETRYITYTWRVELDVVPELQFEVKEPYRLGQESDDPVVAFGWRLAEVVGWTTRK
jgi:hypothetical protein